MKNLKVITECMVVMGQQYKVCTFEATTPEERKIASKPWIAVHHSYTESDMPLNGLQMLISRDLGHLQQRVELDAAIRNFKAAHPDGYTTEELALFLAAQV